MAVSKSCFSGSAGNQASAKALPHWECRLLLRPLGTVLRAALATVFNTRSVECPAHNVVLHTWQVLHTTAANQHNRVLLQVVPLARDIGNDFKAIRQPDFSYFAKCRVWLLRRSRIHTRAYTAALRTIRQRRRLRFLYLWVTPFAHQLLNRRHGILLRYDTSSIRARNRVPRGYPDFFQRTV